MVLECQILMAIYGTALNVLENKAKITEASGLTRLCGITWLIAMILSEIPLREIHDPVGISVFKL